jgi:hypothetical protein
MGYFLSSAVTFLSRSVPIHLVLLVAGLGAVAFGFVALASAQTSGIRVTELQCNADPEVVTITNNGGQPLELSGWALKSDPATSESFDLSVVGTLATGVSVFVEAGPRAEGSFVWSREPVLRDSDATDFVRVVDAGGQAVDEVKCQGGSPAGTPAATTRPTTEPTAAPTVAPADGVPVGGGPPGAGSWATATIVLAAGLWILAVAMGAVGLIRLSDTAEPLSVDPRRGFVRPNASMTAAGGGRWLYAILVLILAAVGAVAAINDRDKPGKS